MAADESDRINTQNRLQRVVWGKLRYKAVLKVKPRKLHLIQIYPQFHEVAAFFRNSVSNNF
jgi:hypothetical protein